MFEVQVTADEVVEEMRVSAPKEFEIAVLRIQNRKLTEHVASMSQPAEAARED